MTIALAAVGAALATLVVTLLFQWAVRRSSDSDDRLTQVVRELEARMDEMVHELSGALEQSQLEGQRTQMLGELAGSIDLDEVLTRVLEAAGAVDGVDATLVTLSPQPGGEPIVATLGLTAEEAERSPGPHDHDLVRIRGRRAERRRRGDPIRSCRSPAGRDRPARIADDLHALFRALVRRGGGPGTGGAGAARRPRDRECAPLPGSSPARRPRRAHRLTQPALLP